MKFNISKNELLKILRFNEKIVDEKITINPVLNNINLIINKNQSKCICSNGVISGCYEINNEQINIEENGKILIKNKILLEIVSKINDEYISFQKLENTVLLIKAKNFSSTINIIDDTTYPNINFSFNDLPFLEISNETISEILKKNSNCVFYDINQIKAISGIYFDTKINKNKLTTLSTDTFKLTYLISEINTDLEINFIVNVPTLNIVNQLFKQNEKNILFFIDEDNKRILIRDGNITIIDRSVTGEFPVSIFMNAFNINKKTSIVVDKNELINALELGKVTVNLEKNPLTIFNVDLDSIELSSSSSQIGSSKINLPIDSFAGDKIKISFNISFLLTLLKNIDSKKIKLFIESNIKPMLIIGDDENYKELILPSRINN